MNYGINFILLIAAGFFYLLAKIIERNPRSGEKGILNLTYWALDDLSIFSFIFSCHIKRLTLTKFSQMIDRGGLLVSL